jgi:hypothetical protein
MKQKIIDFGQDEVNDWYAVLACGHTRHVRHNPPWFNRPWVENAASRERCLGAELDCLKCEQ